MRHRIKEPWWLKDDLRWVMREYRWDVWEKTPPVEVPPGAWLVRVAAPGRHMVSWYPPFFQHPLEVVASVRGNWAGTVHPPFPTRDQMEEYNGYRCSFTKFCTSAAAALYLTVPEVKLLYHLLTPFHTAGSPEEMHVIPVLRRELYRFLDVPGDADTVTRVSRRGWTEPLYQHDLSKEYLEALK